jgi:hypothetical protein
MTSCASAFSSPACESLAEMQLFWPSDARRDRTCGEACSTRLNAGVTIGCRPAEITVSNSAPRPKFGSAIKKFNSSTNSQFSLANFQIESQGSSFLTPVRRLQLRRVRLQSVPSQAQKRRGICKSRMLLFAATNETFAIQTPATKRLVSTRARYRIRCKRCVSIRSI